MTTRHFAIVGVRLLGVAAIVVGVVLAISSGVMRALDAGSIESMSTSNLHLHDTYYLISHIEDVWLVPGAVSGVTGILLFVVSRHLGAWLARGTEAED